MSRLLGALAALILAALPAAAQAPAGYPSQAVRFIVPFAAGGATDVLARVLTKELSERLGKSFVVDNKPGANGIPGLEALARAAPDGYTIGMGALSPLAINPALYAKLPYDVAKDFVAISGMATLPIVLIVNAKAPADDLKGLVAHLKAKGTAFYGSPGVGNTSHLYGELFKKVTGVKLEHIPYKGGNLALQDLVKGEIDLTFQTIIEALPQIRAGTVKPIALFWSKRSRDLPDTPTMAELGVAGFESPTWFGVIGPAGIPQPIVDYLNAEIRVSLGRPEVQQTFARLSVEAMSMSPAAFGDWIAAEGRKWGPLVKESGAKVE
ncbi:MAG: Bug family tripartite tricarboxylate transporter substrate binding protein [Rhodospirillales bacterium]